MESLAKPKIPILSTAGAIPIKNEKGDISMEKVKVSRYVSGKRPEYAPDSSDEDEEAIEFSLAKQQFAKLSADAGYESKFEEAKDDRRLRRLQERLVEEVDSDEDREARVLRHRQMLEPEVIAAGNEDDQHNREESSEEEEEELDDEEIERRRELLRQKVKTVKKDEEVLDLEEEKDSDDEDIQKHDESSEYEEYSESEEEDTGPRLKPVFVRKKDRITIQEKEKEQQKLKDLETEAKRLASERRQYTLKLVEQEIKKDLEHEKLAADAGDSVRSDDENDEEEYEAWKIRELKRIKHDREEREAIEKEKHDLERIHNLTEEERRQEQKSNPKVVTNKMSKGKYKFLQKYYHRGAFFLDKEDEVFKRDFSAPTLEDHFNKTVLPKVMQVKNFGRSGRTKYTHLVDQDTTQFDAPWADNSALNIKFHASISAGMKQTFERPSVKKRK